MFLVENNVPEVYTQESRDFQLFCKLYDLVFQSSRYSIDSLQRLTDTNSCNNTVLQLFGTKIGLFEELTNVPDRVQRMILSAFPHIIRAKGSFKGLQLVANLFTRITRDIVTVSPDEEDLNKVYVNFSTALRYMSVFTTLIEYIRPAGCILEYRRSVPLTDSDSIDVLLSTDDIVTIATKWQDSTVTVRGSSELDEYKATVGFSKTQHN